MAGSNPQMIIRIAANVEELKKNLAEGKASIEALGPSVAAMADRWKASSDKLIQNAHNITAAIAKVGTSTMTAGAAAQALKTVDAAMAQLARTSQAIPPEMAKIAEELRKVTDAGKGAKGSAEGLFASLTQGVAVGTLIADTFKAVGSAILGAIQSAAMALPNMIQQTIDLGGSLFDMSLKTGASVENLSRLRYVSSQTGISMESFTNSMYKMQVALGGTGTKADETRKALGQLGLDMGALKNSRPDDAFIAILSGLEKIPNRADQARVGMALFGKGFKDMAGLTQESITELLKASDDLGLTMTTELAAAADIAGDAIARIKMQGEALAMRIGAAFLPAVIGLAENFSTILKDAIDETNTSLDAMGKGGGFLATVARAMGSGNEALAAQVQLYKMLRDALISFVRTAVMPTITALSYLMIGFNAAKVVFGDVAQVIDGLVVAYQYLHLAMVKVASLSPGAMLNKKLYQDMADDVNRSLDLTMDRMMKRAESLKQAKANEEWWADGATKANAAVEAALTKLGATHFDVAKMIEQNAALSRAAFGGTGEDIDQVDKKMEALNDETAKLQKTFETLQAKGVSGEDIFKALGSGAAGLREKFAAFGQDVPADVQKVVEAIKAMGREVQIAEWMQKQRADVRKILEDMAKDTEALATKQRDALNKAFTGNLDVQLKAQGDLTKLEQDSLDKRLALVRADMEARRNALDKNASNYASSLATVTRLEEESATQATQAWNEHVEDVANLLPSFGDLFANALSGIPDIIKSALTGGGGISGAIGAIFSDLTASIGQKLFSSADGIGQKLAQGAVNLFGGQIGGKIAGAMPAIGSALGSVLSTMSSSTNKAVSTLGQAGSWAMQGAAIGSIIPASGPPSARRWAGSPGR